MFSGKIQSASILSTDQIQSIGTSLIYSVANAAVGITQGTLSATFGGPFANYVISDINWLKINRFVFMNFPLVSAACTLAAIAAATATLAIPAYLRPSVIMNEVLSINANGLLAAPGKCVLQTNGNVTIYAGLTEAVNFGVLNNNGWAEFTISYYS